MATRINITGAHVTGETQFYFSMMQEWVHQSLLERDIECYCLDAPLHLPTGSVRACHTGGCIIGYDALTLRDDS